MCSDLIRGKHHRPSLLMPIVLYSHNGTELLQTALSLTLMVLNTGVYIPHGHSSAHLRNLLILGHICISHCHNVVTSLIPQNWFLFWCQLYFTKILNSLCRFFGGVRGNWETDVEIWSIRQYCSLVSCEYFSTFSPVNILVLPLLFWLCLYHRGCLLWF